MRLDDFLSTVGVIKRRTIAKEMAANGLVLVGDKRAKPAYSVKLGDIIEIKGTRPAKIEVLAIPGGSVSKEKRDDCFKLLTS